MRNLAVSLHSDDLIMARKRSPGPQRLFEYALSKPLDKGGAPPGYVGHRKARKLITWKYRHGIVQYRRPLREEVIIKYKLEPLTPEDPWVMEMIMDVVADDVLGGLIENNIFEVSVKGGNVAVIETDWSPGGKLLLQLYNPAGNKVGKPKKIRRADDASKTLWPMFTPAFQQEYKDLMAVDI
jgi:hypothetical protein